MNENKSELATVENGISVPHNAQKQIEQAKEMINFNMQLLKEVLQPGVDFDRIQGTDKPTLLKSGAEMLCKVYGLSQGNMQVTDKTEDWEKGIFCYTVTCPIIHIASGNVVAVGMGAANSYEKKYRYRNKYEGDNKVKTENPDPADNINTLIKMASKRAFVDAVLKATCASRIFTQDLDEFRQLAESMEKASTKQIDFIRKLTNNDLNRVKAILNRDVKSFDDILRSEASPLIDQLKNSNNGNYGGGYGNNYGGSYNAPPDYNYAPPPPADYAPPVEDYGAPIDQPQPQQSQPANNENLVCADCGAKITKAEHGYSSTKFGRALCRNCQNRARNGG